MSESYLITGATGFIGANIVRKLVFDKKNVHVLTRNKKLNWRLLDIRSKITIHEADLLDENSVKKITVKIKPTYVFHLAAYGSLPAEENVDDLINVNLRGTINLINAVKQNKFKLFINTGSSSEYGVRSIPMKETDLLMPINDYGVTKTAATLFVQKEAVRNSLPIITFRLFSVYGPYEEATRLIPYVILSAINNRRIDVGSPSHVRDFIYMKDLVDAYLHVRSVSVPPGEIFNIGTGRQFTVGDVVEKTIRLSESKSKVRFWAVKKQERQVESKSWCANTNKTERILGWRARYTFDRGLKEMIEWFKKNKNLYE